MPSPSPSALNELSLRDVEDGVVLQVRVQPRSKRSAVTGVHGGALKCSLTAPPVEGAANAALIELLAQTLGVPRRTVQLARGEQSRHKTVRVQGLDAATLRDRLLRVFDAQDGAG
jgi:uncharacterized protein (TIGR00251 family)